MRRKLVVFVMLLVALVPMLSVVDSLAATGMKAPPPEVAEDVIIIGDRVVDIAYNLGIVPRAMSVRAAMWPMAKQLKTAVQILGCPNCIVTKPETVPDACKKFGIKRLIVEKSKPYCLFKKNADPVKVVPLMDGKGVAIEYVDFSGGLDAAVRQTAELLGCTERADAVIEKYNKQLKIAEKKLPSPGLQKKVLVFNGTCQVSTGKILLRVEAPDGYSDRFLLSRLGCENVGDAFKPADGTSSNGYYFVKKTKEGLDLTPVLKVAPDMIVMVGDVFAVQKALAMAVAQNPEMKSVPAVKKMQIYALPSYVDAGVLEYPAVLQKWTAALLE